LAATGAAAVPALALCGMYGMYGSFAWLARRELRRTSAG
jgi:hypothetical protein